jgi:hypothetical protein
MQGLFLEWLRNWQLLKKGSAPWVSYIKLGFVMWCPHLAQAIKGLHFIRMVKVADLSLSYNFICSNSNSNNNNNNNNVMHISHNLCSVQFWKQGSLACMGMTQVTFLIGNKGTCMEEMLEENKFLCWSTYSDFSSWWFAVLKKLGN